ncbi:MAG: hypothetical protein Q9227_002051 [Pyrenula ochraceoflavens]
MISYILPFLLALLPFPTSAAAASISPRQAGPQYTFNTPSLTPFAHFEVQLAPYVWSTDAFGIVCTTSSKGGNVTGGINGQILAGTPTVRYLPGSDVTAKSTAHISGQFMVADQSQQTLVWDWAGIINFDGAQAHLFFQMEMSSSAPAYASLNSKSFWGEHQLVNNKLSGDIFMVSTSGKKDGSPVPGLQT